MKREVRRSVVERGVAERTRLMDLYKQRTEDLRKQHDIVRNNLMEHKTMVYNIIKKFNLPLRFFTYFFFYFRLDKLSTKNVNLALVSQQTVS